MWTPENIAALCTGITGIIGAVTALAGLFVHVRNPDAHQGQAGPTVAGPGGAGPAQDG